MLSLADIYITIASFLWLIYQRIRPPTLTTDVAFPTPSSTASSGSRRPVRLPVETLELIFAFHIASVVKDMKFVTVRDFRVRQRSFMMELYKVATCSRLFQQVMKGSLRMIWAYTGRRPSPVANPGADDLPARGVRIITAEMGSFPLNFNLADYEALEVASINYHGGVQWNRPQQCFLRHLCISAYPRSLRQLEILRLHTPEEEVIRLLSDCCPGLTELRLVRCTLFNDPTCWYWRTHTRNQDHDYMQSHDPAAVVAYANRMALLLRELQQLGSIHIGHYLTSINSVYAHRIDEAHRRYHPITDRTNHIDGVKVLSHVHLMAMASQDEGPPINRSAVRLADLELWARPCSQCEREFAQPIERAERLAAMIFASHFGSLKQISFAGFLSERRIRPSSWRVGRERRGEEWYAWAEIPNRSRSRIMERMTRVDNRWEPLQLQ